MEEQQQHSQKKQTAPAASGWELPDKKPVAVDSNAVKLFCVPQAGMGAWVYQSFSERLAPHIQVWEWAIRACSMMPWCL